MADIRITYEGLKELHAAMLANDWPCRNCGGDRDEPQLKFCWRCRRVVL